MIKSALTLLCANLCLQMIYCWQRLDDEMAITTLEYIVDAIRANRRCDQIQSNYRKAVAK